MTWKTGSLHLTCGQRMQSCPFPFNKITQNSRPLAWSSGMLKMTSKFWLVSQKLSAPRSPGSKEEAVYNSVSSETLSVTGNKGLKRSSQCPHWVCFLIHRNITGPKVTKKPDFCALHRLPGWNSTDSNPKANSTLRAPNRKTGGLFLSSPRTTNQGRSCCEAL